MTARLHDSRCTARPSRKRLGALTATLLCVTAGCGTAPVSARLPVPEAIPNAVVLHVDSVSGMVDDVVHIGVSGLEPNQLVRVTATSRTVTDRALISYGVFRADDSGRVDVGTAKPIEGTYSQPDPMGLFWSMTPQMVPEAIWEHLDIQPFYTPKNWTVILEVAPNEGGRVLATKRIERRYVAAGVRAIDVRTSGIVGKLMLPPLPANGGRVPGIIMIGGSEGGFDETGAALLASHGYAALALAYFKEEGLPAQLVNIPGEYFLRALDWLRSRPEVAADRVGIIGGSRGSEMALWMATVRSDVRAVVAMSPSSIFWEGIPRPPTSVKVAAWTFGGKPLPFLATEAPADLVREFFAKGPLQSRLYDYLFSDSTQVERATIPIEKIRGRVLLISGKDDRVWGSPIMAERIMARARQFHLEDAFTSISYDSTGHIISEPFRPTPAQSRLGGTTAAHARAEQDSWPRILAFLARNLSEP